MTTRSGYAAAYTQSSLSTASPQKLIVLLYDRLVLDLDRAEHALLAGDAAGRHLVHAQDIIMELLSSLDLDVWDGAAGLQSLYTYLHTELVRANVRRDVAKVVACRELIVPLRDAWREALAGMSAAPARVVDLSTHVPVSVTA
jgi:flagellar protein FliS